MFRAGVIPLLVRRQPAGDAQGLRLTPTLISTTAVATSLFQRRKPRGPESNRPPRGHSLSVAKLHPMLETALTRPHQAPQLSKLRTDTLMTSRGERPLLSIEDQGSWGSRLSQLPQPISSQIELTESAKGQRSQGHLDPWYTE